MEIFSITQLVKNWKILMSFKDISELRKLCANFMKKKINESNNKYYLNLILNNIILILKSTKKISKESVAKSNVRLFLPIQYRNRTIKKKQ